MILNQQSKKNSIHEKLNLKKKRLKKFLNLKSQAEPGPVSFISSGFD
jgi:hypothetical protein